MTEVDMLVRDTLADRAESAPTGAGLLARVQTRSRLIRRRRRVGAAGAGVAAVLLGVAAVPAVSGLLPGDAPREGVGSPATAKPSPTALDPSASPTPPPTVNAVLGPPNFTLPTVPFRPATGVIPGLPEGLAMFDGTPMIMHTSGAEKDPLLMVYINRQAESVPGEETVVQVHGVPAKLITPTDPVHPGLQLSWTEPDGTPMWISAGNVTGDQVVAYANALKREDMPVVAPFSFQQLPKGLELHVVGGSDMIFGQPGQDPNGTWQYKLGFILGADGDDDAASWPLRVGSNKAKNIPQEDGGRMLMVALPDGNVLSVQVPVNLKISDADLLRMAAGVTVNAGAKASRG